MSPLLTEEGEKTQDVILRGPPFNLQRGGGGVEVCLK